MWSSGDIVHFLKEQCPGDLFTWQAQEKAALSCFVGPAVSTQNT